MSHDLLRGTCKLMLMMKTLNSVGLNPCSHYTTASLVTNLCTYELASPRRLCLYK
jgi:hypothetical protein